MAKYKTLADYVQANGYKVSDLTEDELREAQDELDIINAGGEVLDGVFSDPGLTYRKK